jgi:rhamnosyltransferase
MRVLAVAITYNPELALFARMLDSVAPQVEGVAVIDNGSGNAPDVGNVAAAAGAQFLANQQNVGIAAAQNQGLDLASATGFSHVLLLDQDTVLSPGVVNDLSAQLQALERGHGGVAAIGPAYFEMHSGRQTRAYRAGGPRLSRLSLAGKAEPIASDFIIASGSLIPVAVIAKVGRFNEDLFIDLVDVDWCFRARAAGYTSFISPTARVDHHLGRGTVNLGLRRVAVHVPIRNYYWVRNALWLARQPYTPLAWRLYFVSRSLAFLATYSTLADERILRLRLIGRGIRDSLMGHLGPLRQR